MATYAYAYANLSVYQHTKAKIMAIAAFDRRNISTTVDIITTEAAASRGISIPVVGEQFAPVLADRQNLNS